MDVFIPDVVEQEIVLTDNGGCVFNSVERFYQDLFVGNQEVSHEILVGSEEERKDKLISALTSKGVTGSSLKIYFSKYLHDWFRMVDEEKGISLGRLLNGIHHNMIRIDDLRDEEVKTIVEEINRTKIEMKK